MDVKTVFPDLLLKSKMIETGLILINITSLSLQRAFLVTDSMQAILISALEFINRHKHQLQLKNYYRSFDMKMDCFVHNYSFWCNAIIIEPVKQF